MKFKSLMLITLVLLAILTIGAASAADDVASDDLAVDDEDVIAENPDDEGIDPGDGENDDSEEEEIWVNDDDDIENDNDVVVEVKAKNDTKYSLEISIKAENEEDEDENIATILLNDGFEKKKAWDENDSFTIYSILLKDVKFTGVKAGSVIVFDLYDESEDWIDSCEFIYNNDSGVITFDRLPEIIVSEDDISDNEDVAVQVMVLNETQATLVIRDNNGNTLFSKDLKDIAIKEIDGKYAIYNITRGMLDLTITNNESSITFKLIEGADVIAEGKYFIYFDEDNAISFEEDDSEDEGDEWDDGDDPIYVDDINFDEPNESFVLVSVEDVDDLIFKIVVKKDDGDLILYSTDLSESAEYDFDDEMYYFELSYNDWNKYISQNIKGADNLLDLFENKTIKNDDAIYFYIGDDEYKYSIAIARGNDAILFDRFEPATAEFYNLDILMKDDWQDDSIMGIIVKEEFNPKVVVKLYDEEVFNKTLDYSEAVDYEGYKLFSIAINNLTKTLENKTYKVYVEIYNGTNLLYDNSEDDKYLTLYAPQIGGNDNVTIEIIPLPMELSDDDGFIVIKANDTTGNVSVLIGESETPIVIPLKSCRYDEDNKCYIIGSKELGIKAIGDYTLTVKYSANASDAVEITGDILLITNIDMELRDSEDILYTGEFGDNTEIVAFRLSNGEISNDNVNGTVKVYIYFDGENATLCFEGDLKDLEINKHMRAKVINVGDLKNIGSDLVGTYNVTVVYEGGSNAPVNATSEITFKKLGTDDFDVEITDDAVIISEIPEVDGFIVITTDVGSKTYSFEEIGDMREYEFDDVLIPLGDGVHKVTVSFKVDENSDKLLELDSKVLSTIDPALNITIANIFEGNDAIITITADKRFTGNVTVKIGNSTYNVTVTEGAGSRPVSGLAVGDYNATATSAAFDMFDASTKNTTFTVSPKIVTVISAPAVTTTYATSKNIIVTLKDANGNVLANKTVTILLNGVTKTLTTDAKGQVSLPIGTNLVPKKYDATIKFAGDDAYAASTSTVKVTVNKAKAKMTAKKKTFKAKTKTKKYTIVLKTDKNKALKKVKVTIKVGKKTYKAKTNAKGKATFKLKKLTKKGKYKAVVKFAGNKYYNKVTKKVKITVK